jgi:hypothetical protein
MRDFSFVFFDVVDSTGEEQLAVDDIRKSSIRSQWSKLREGCHVKVRPAPCSRLLRRHARAPPRSAPQRVRALTMALSLRVRST